MTPTFATPTPNANPDFWTTWSRSGFGDCLSGILSGGSFARGEQRSGSDFAWKIVSGDDNSLMSENRIADDKRDSTMTIYRNGAPAESFNTGTHGCGNFHEGFSSHYQHNRTWNGVPPAFTNNFFDHWETRSCACGTFTTVHPAPSAD